MVENRPWLTFVAHAILLLGVLVVAFPLYVTFIASTQTLDQVINVPMSLLPGDQMIDNYAQVLRSGSKIRFNLIAGVAAMAACAIMMCLSVHTTSGESSRNQVPSAVIQYGPPRW